MPSFTVDSIAIKHKGAGQAVVRTQLNAPPADHEYYVDQDVLDEVMALSGPPSFSILNVSNLPQ